MIIKIKLDVVIYSDIIDAMPQFNLNLNLINPFTFLNLKPSQNKIFREASLFPLKGELKYLKFGRSNLKKIKFVVEEGFLLCLLPNEKSPNDFRDQEYLEHLQSFYKKQAISYLRDRVDFWSQSTGLRPSQLKFNRARTRWGSCNSNRIINLNWKLICYAPSLIDYVIVHELSHLKFLNHSKDFWNLLAQFMPEYSTYEKVLNEEHKLCYFLNS